MSPPRSRRLRLGSPLLLRIYLVALVQFVLVIAVMDFAREYVLDKPWRQGFSRNMAYLVNVWAGHLEQPEALRAELAQVRRQLDVQVTLRATDGRLLAANMEAPLEVLSPEALRQLEAARIHHAEASRMLTVAWPQEGPVRAYARILLPPRPEPPILNTVVLVGVVLGCTALTSIVFARTLAVPLQRLAAVARDFGAGALGVRTGLRRRDELGQVAEAFDEMAGRLTHLLRSQKELLANVSHELRTPLARIRMALDWAAEGDTSRARESLKDIAEDLGELERLVEDVLTTARLDLASDQASGATQPLRLERVDTQALLDKAATRFRSARPQHRLEVDVPGALPALYADPVLLRRVFDNVLDNAGKYSEPGSTVRLSARPVGATLQVEVRDEGIGIDAADLPRISTPFFRTDRSRARATGGVGLGLALVRRIVDAHGGTLALESQPGVGTTVRVMLPGEQAAEQQPLVRHLS